MMRKFISLISAALLAITPAAAQQYPSPTLNNVTVNGNLTLPAKPANTVFAGGSGGAGVPTFRPLVGADVPAANLAASGNGGVTGTLPGANMSAVNLATSGNGGVTGTLPGANMTPVNLASGSNGGVTGTLSGANMTPINLASTANGGVSGVLSVSNGGTGVTGSTGTGATVRNTNPAFVGTVTGQASSFTNLVTGPTTDGANVVASNTTKTATDIYSPMVPPGWFFWGLNRAVLDVQPGTAVQGVHAYDAYTFNNVPAATLTGQDKNVVGLFVDGVNAVAGAKSWGLNTSCGDSVNNTVPSSVASTCIGYEIDFTVYNTGTSVEGLPMLIQGPVMPASANGVHISTASGSVAKWTNGLVTDNGAVVGRGVSLGATAVSGANTPSQPITMGYFNAGNVNQGIQLQASPTAALNLTSTEQPDGLALVTGSGNISTVAFGSSSNINVNYASKGSGTHKFNAPVEVTGNLSSTATVSGATVTSSGNITASANVAAVRFTPTTAAPSVTTCGTGGSAVAGSGNNMGNITFGTGTVTACTLTFANPYNNRAFCSITPSSNYTGTFYISAQSNVGFILTTGANAAGQSFNYVCFGN